MLSSRTRAYVQATDGDECCCTCASATRQLSVFKRLATQMFESFRVFVPDLSVPGSGLLKQLEQHSLHTAAVCHNKKTAEMHTARLSRSAQSVCILVRSAAQQTSEK